MLTCVSFVAIEEYLRKLSCGLQADRQTEIINTFQLSLESVKKVKFECLFGVISGTTEPILKIILLKASYTIPE